MKQFNKSLKHIYDILCFAPLWVVNLIENKPKSLKTVVTDEQEPLALESDDAKSSKSKKKDAAIHLNQEAK